MSVLHYLLLCAGAALASAAEPIEKEFCILGAGPGSMQLGHYLNGANYDYIMFEKRQSPGNFFRRLPIHRSLISINKRFPADRDNAREDDYEFRLRHDWNSLLDTNITPVGERTNNLWPEADVVAEYLEEFAQPQVANGRIKLDTEVKHIRRSTGTSFMVDIKGPEGEQTYHCGRIISGMGIGKPQVPTWPGADLVIKYHEVDSEGAWAEGLRVAILGSGNAAFEVSYSIKDTSPEAVIFTRTKPKMKNSELRFAYKTHYVGDVRIKVADLVEHYQFQSMDKMVQFTTGNYAVFKCKGDKLCFTMSEAVTDCHGRENAERLTFTIPAEGSLGAGVTVPKENKSMAVFDELDVHGMADKMGIKAGDCIATVNGADATGKTPAQWGPKPWKVEVLRSGDHWIPTSVGMTKKDAQSHVERLKKIGVTENEIRVSESQVPAARGGGAYLKRIDEKRKRDLSIAPQAVGPYEEKIKRNKVDVKYSSIAARPEVADLVADLRNETLDDAMRIPFDKIISCYGWKMENHMYAPDIVPQMDPLGKRPNITDMFESVNVPGLYFVGALMHAVDFRKSAGGFIHGFRYLARLMFHRIQEEKGIPFPHKTFTLTPEQLSAGLPELQHKLVTRWRTASAPYQMYSYLGDGMIFRHDEESGNWLVDYYQDVSLSRFHREAKNQIHMTWHFKYGERHHGDGVLNANVPHTGYYAENSNFLHPVIELHFPTKGKSENTIERHYVREDVPQMYNSTNHHFFLNNYMKFVVADKFHLGQCTRDHVCDQVDMSTTVN